jgi:hypothetical protein
MNSILQGTTPTLTIAVDQDDLLLSDIVALELTFQQVGDPVYKHKPDVTIDTEANTVSYHFTQAETLALIPSRLLNWQIRFALPDGNIVGTPVAQISVSDLISNEVMA